ncbi:MAG: hypothetical protein AVDCRST_MAG34-1973, partial [uncultured Nocardioidaceae bacterium]
GHRVRRSARRLRHRCPGHHRDPRPQRAVRDRAGAQLRPERRPAERAGQLDRPARGDGAGVAGARRGGRGVAPGVHGHQAGRRGVPGLARPPGVPPPSCDARRRRRHRSRHGRPPPGGPAGVRRRGVQSQGVHHVRRRPPAVRRAGTWRGHRPAAGARHAGVPHRARLRRPVGAAGQPAEDLVQRLRRPRACPRCCRRALDDRPRSGARHDRTAPV